VATVLVVPKSRPKLWVWDIMTPDESWGRGFKPKQSTCHPNIAIKDQFVP
jgi:hypothetical protein